MAGGIVVTRAASDHSLGADIGKQMFRTSRPLWIVSGVLLALALIPGMPKISFIAARRTYDVCGLEDEAGSAAESLAGSQGRSGKGGARRAPPSIRWMRC